MILTLSPTSKDFAYSYFCRPFSYKYTINIFPLSFPFLSYKCHPEMSFTEYHHENLLLCGSIGRGKSERNWFVEETDCQGMWCCSFLIRGA